MDWLPGATRRPLAGGFTWQVSCPTKGVLHTTEGYGVPDYPADYEPHLTVVPTAGKGVAVYQHVPLTRGSYALRHAAGTVSTNGAHAIQIELSGTCDPRGPKGAYFWPHADDAVLKDLFLTVIKPLSDTFGIQLVVPAFKAYPASSGTSNGVRFSENTWLAWKGWCGHQHVPGGNNHGDPGEFPWARLLVAGGGTPPQPRVITIHGPVRYGDQGADVREIQKKLDSQAGVSLDTDGMFGHQTLIALQAWQKKHSLTADGVVGPATAKSMGFAYAAK